MEINAGFYVADIKLFKYLNSKSKDLEGNVLNKFSKNNNLNSNYVTKWCPMDNQQDKMHIEKLLKKDSNFFGK